MSQLATSYAWQQKMKTPNNHSYQHANGHSVRDTIRQFDRLGHASNLASTPPPPLPPPPHRSPVPININNKNTSINSSVSSSIGSDTSEKIGSSNPMEHKRPSDNGKVIGKTHHRRKPQISTTRPDNRSSVEQKSTKYRRRSPPPIPSKYTSYGADDAIYVNSDNEFEEPRIVNQLNGNFTSHDDGEIEQPKAFTVFAKPITVYRDHQSALPPQTKRNSEPNIGANDRQRRGEKLPPPLPPRLLSNQFTNDDVNSIGLEIIEPSTAMNRRQIIGNDRNASDRPNNGQRAPTMIDDYEIDDIQNQYRGVPPPYTHRPTAQLPPLRPPPPPAFAMPYLQRGSQIQETVQEEPQSYKPKRTFPLSNFMLEIGALLVVFIVCIVLVLAIREDQTKLRITMLVVYIYIYAVSMIWMIWCTLDIIKFRRDWMKLIGPVLDHEEYGDIIERHSNKMFYFPDIHNTGGLFMRIGAGLLCMGGLILTVIELAEAIASAGSHGGTTRAALQTQYSLSVTITRSITYIFRFLFHCVQFTFLFRYGNLIIDRYHSLAKIGLIHLVIANFCTWFEAIVHETLDQINNPRTNTLTSSSTSIPFSSTIETTAELTTTDDGANGTIVYLIRDMSNNVAGIIDRNTTTLEILSKIEETMSIYLYPCLIEYSLISLTVFFIMWRNVGKTENRSFLRFGARHVFTVNCSRASRGLLIGGIIFLLTILTLIPTYMLDKDAISVTHLTELVLLIVALVTVCMSYFQTTTLHYDQHAHIDVFDQTLILITTVGDFAYSFFGLFASLLADNPETKLPVGIEVSIGFIALFQTFLQTGFILDTLKRRTTTKQEIRQKPGRETITALLLMNLAIWLHDSLSAKKVLLNPLQNAYYDRETWAIIQAFTSPLSIFYRFHSSVCLADIWQEVYQDRGNEDKHRSINGSNDQDNTN